MKRIHAQWDEQGIRVYQAFSPEIVEAAVALGTFGRGFGLERMTWIKPSFGWMLHRSEYATAHRQERIVKVTLSHKGFREILSQAVLSSWNRDVHPEQKDWQLALKRNPARCQWDPDRTILGRPMERRAIQLGLSGAMVRLYVHEWILGIEDVTPLVHTILRAKENGAQLPEVPEELDYPVDQEIEQRLGMTRLAVPTSRPDG